MPLERLSVSGISPPSTQSWNELPTLLTPLHEAERVDECQPFRRGNFDEKIVSMHSYAFSGGLRPPDDRNRADQTTGGTFPRVYLDQAPGNSENQTLAPDCPASGTFEAWVLSDQSNGFSPACRDQLMTLVYSHFCRWRRDFQSSLVWPSPSRTTVKLRAVHAPSTRICTPALEANGYTRNLNIRVAGYDWRLAPDMGGFLQRTIGLIEQTYADNGNTPVHLVAHSNGPLYTQYLLTHTSQAWKNKFIHGFTPIAKTGRARDSCIPFYSRVST